MSESDSISIVIESDLDSQGRLGSTTLTIENGLATRTELTHTGTVTVAEYKISDLTKPRLEDLIDATALVADRGDITVELIRATNRKNLPLANAEKQLKALVEGKPIPDVDNATRVCPKCSRPLPQYNNVCEACVNKGQTLKRLFEYTKPFRGRLIWGSLLAIGGMLLELIPPYITKVLIDDALAKRNSPLFYQLIGGFLLVRIMVMLVQIARGRNVGFLGAKIAVSIRNSLFDKLQSLSLNFYDKRNVGSLMSRMTNDTGAIYDVLVDGIPVILNQLVLMIGIPVLMIVINWKIGLLAILPIPLVVVAVHFFRKKMNRVWSRYWHQWSRVGSTLNGILQGTRVVKAFHGEDREVSRFNRRISALADSGYVAESSWATFFPIVLFTMGFSVITVWFVGGRGVIRGVLTVGELTAFIAYVQRLNDPLMNLQRVIDWSTRALTAAERVFEIMDTPVDIIDTEKSVHMPNVRGDVKLTDVHFGYDKLRSILHGVDIDVKAGEMIGIVGHSGSGKTTLINMILRFYDPTQGKVELDGVNLKDIKIDDFRRQVGVVLQESYLFPGSIKDNIAYGNPDASMQQIMEAAKSANAHDFICKFPDGYDTYCGERGQRLSGGERQRISIARAILHNPKVLVLDEATASVDTETERMIQEAIENLVDGRTVFAIAHRLSTLRNADRLVVMDDGRVAEIGTHEELLAKEGGIYAKLVSMQSEISKMQANVLGGAEAAEEESKETAGV
jgi:ATP-binding cassette, subfamily B, bacterial